MEKTTAQKEHEGLVTGKLMMINVSDEDVGLLTKFPLEEIKGCSVIYDKDAAIKDGDLAVITIRPNEEEKIRRITFHRDEESHSPYAVLEDGGGYKTIVRNLDTLKVLGRVTRSFTSL